MLYQLSYRRSAPRSIAADYACGTVQRSAIPLVVAVLAAALVGLLVYGVVQRGDDKSLDGAVQRGELPAAPGADVRLPVLGGSAQQSLADLRGKVVVLNFWAS